MVRKPAPEPLTLAGSSLADEDPPPGETLPISSTTSPSDSRSPRSPLSPFRFGPKKPQGFGSKQSLPAADVSAQQQPQSPPEQADAPIPSSATFQHPAEVQRSLDTPPPATHRQRRNHHRQDEEKASKSGFFFNFAKSSRSTDRLQAQHYAEASSETMSRGSNTGTMTKQNSKTPDPIYNDGNAQKPVPSLPSKSDLSLASSDFDSTPTSSSTKRGKPKPFALLSRTRSFNKTSRDNDKDGPSPKEGASAPVEIVEPDRSYAAGPLRTAPVNQPDRSFREMMSSAARNHSAERSQARDFTSSRERYVERDRMQPSSLKDNSSAFLSGLKSSSSRAADILSKGLFGKSTRSGSTNEREPMIDDEHYVLKVIHLPLIEQTRLTRISKRLEDSRDKTEFWMPAFPWRAIDYLNYKGCDVEGLYRVPGSGPQIKRWQRRFDEEGDVDLFAQKDLYDINIIGSMLKAWLRELPDELFPKEAQERIARECIGSEKVPQMLVDELSNLSPFNYYLLFAITCHLSLLLAHSDKNKMDFRNLCICFQPCMKIDAFCFKFLVCDWRDCWKGCKHEAKFIEEEYTLFDLPPPRVVNDARKPDDGAVEDRNVSSSDSSKQSNQNGGDQQQKGRLKKKSPPGVENGSVASNSTISTTLTVNSERETPPRRSGDLRPLSPIKPLSPLGF